MVMSKECKNKKNDKTIATAAMEERRKRGRPRKRGRDKVEGDLNIMGIKNRHATARDRQDWRKIVSEAKVHNGLQRLRSRI
jgi:hypothetical protein